MATKRPNRDELTELISNDIDSRQLQKPSLKSVLKLKQRKEKKIQVNFSIEPSTYEELKNKLSEEEGLSIGAGLRFIIHKYLKN